MAKNSINEMAEELGIKKENLDKGLKGKHKKHVEDAINKAYAFKTKKRSKK